MNVRDQRKRFGSPVHSFQYSSFDFSVLSNSLSDEIPKFNVGANDNNQQENNTNDLPEEENNLQNVNDLGEDPFDQLQPNLFDSSDQEYSKYDEIRDTTTLKLQITVKSQPYRKIGHYGRSPQKIVSDYKIDFHMLTPLLHYWLNSKPNVNKNTLKEHNYQMSNLIKFLIDNNIQHPTADHVLTYIKYNILSLNTGITNKKSNISSICVFFRWAEKNNKYKNIMKGITPSKIFDPIASKSIQSTANTITNPQLTHNEGSLSKILNLWVQNLGDDNVQKIRYKSVMYSLITFFVENNITNPTSDDITEYYTQYIFIRDNIKVEGSFDIIKNFFNWTCSIGIYDNIAENTSPKYTPVSETEINQLRNELIDKTQGTNGPKMTIKVSEMVKAGFPPNQAESLINNELIIFKRWIESLKFSDLNNILKNCILKFAYFLCAGGILIPTQENLEEYYNHVIKKNALSINNHITAIKSFFRWTDQQNIYPNITRNVISVNRIQPGKNISILYDQSDRLPIASTNRPLIGIIQQE